ncbi:unnamed protein product [Closterium sp. NIES-54]
MAWNVRGYAVKLGFPFRERTRTADDADPLRNEGATAMEEVVEEAGMAEAGVAEGSADEAEEVEATVIGCARTHRTDRP